MKLRHPFGFHRLDGVGFKLIVVGKAGVETNEDYSITEQDSQTLAAIAAYCGAKKAEVAS